MLTHLTPAEFRRQLAGLSDLTADADRSNEDFREMASDFVLMLAICFNRRRLEATSLWTRIDSAIQKGLAECDGDDIDRLISVSLDHVLANPNVVVAQENAAWIHDGLCELPKSSQVYFCQYLAKHRLAALRGGKRKWEDRKEGLAEAVSELIMEIEIEGEE